MNLIFHPSCPPLTLPFGNLFSFSNPNFFKISLPKKSFSCLLLSISDFVTVVVSKNHTRGSFESVFGFVIVRPSSVSILSMTVFSPVFRASFKDFTVYTLPLCTNLSPSFSSVAFTVLVVVLPVTTIG